MNPVGHYLLTIPTSNEFNMHGYVMADDMKSVRQVGLKMMDELEKMHADCLPAILVTKLDPDGVKLVRDFLHRECPKCDAMLKGATDFHMSAWCTPAKTAANDMLMNLH